MGSGFNSGEPDFAKQFLGFTQRDYNWLYAYLCIELKIEPMELSTQDLKRVCFELLKDLESHIPKILEKKANEVIPTNYISWIAPDNKRLINWLQAQDEYVFKLLCPKNTPPNYNKNLYLNFLLKFDMYINNKYLTKGFFENNYQNNALIIEKIKIIEEIQKTWLEILHITSPLADWIDQASSEQLDWCLEYLHKSLENKKISFSYRLDLFNKMEKTELEILKIVDRIQFSNNAEFIVFFEKIRKAWAQKKFTQANKRKKLYQIPLTMSAKEKLTRLSEAKGISENKLIEQFIDAAYTENMSLFKNDMKL
ncbi:hypothetical protein [Acinetobacter courvalinii]|uniref:Uncharacterized protein n=1 Tax=Acinetobacter courvalinii TaxID=280147 RepID=A0AA42I792_9GAMM|nr:hypothetical protein [Acinetobacter courvalinii]MDH0563839.1 hypothetical protein [Acinetobacter courvalinii]